MNAHGWMVALLDHIGSQPLGGKVRQCPAHRDGSPSLSVRCGRDGQPVLKCFGGCTLAEILAALRCARQRLNTPAPLAPAAYAAMVGLTIDFPPVELREGHPASRGFRLEAVHDYGPAVLYRWRSRSGAKELFWETRTPRGDVPGLIGITLADLPLYRQREVEMAMAIGEPVILVESESSSDAIKGLYSCTWAGSATAVNVGKLAAVLGSYRRLVVIPDADKAGRQAHAQLARAGLADRTIWPDEGHDARDLYGQLGGQRFADAVRDVLAGPRLGRAA